VMFERTDDNAWARRRRLREALALASATSPAAHSARDDETDGRRDGRRRRRRPTSLMRVVNASDAFDVDATATMRILRALNQRK